MKVRKQEKKICRFNVKDPETKKKITGVGRP